MDLTPPSSVRAILDALHSAADVRGVLWYDWAAITLARLSPLVGALPAALQEESVWPSSRRSAIMQRVPEPDIARVNRNFSQVNPAGLGAKGGREFALLLSEARVLSDREGAQGLREWHVAKSMVDTDANKTLPGLGIDPAALLRRVGELEGRVELGPDDLAKKWRFVDANVFLHYQIFDQVDWPKHLGHEKTTVVLVVPTAVLRALDRYKSDREHPRQQKRARQVLPLFGKYALDVPPGVPAPVRSGVELLLRDREPPIPDGFDATDPDDRIGADALEFRWTHPGADVVVLSGDTTVRLRARSRGLQQQKVPDGLELESAKPPPDPAPAASDRSNQRSGGHAPRDRDVAGTRGIPPMRVAANSTPSP